MTQTSAFTEERLDQAHESLRRKHGVRLVEGKEDGAGLHRLPGGVYGYTYSPGYPDTPLFQKSGAHMFEVHKTTGGEIWIVGFVTVQESELLGGGTAFDLALYPGPRDASTELAAIPISRVIHLRQLAIREKGALELRIGSN